MIRLVEKENSGDCMNVFRKRGVRGLKEGTDSSGMRCSFSLHLLYHLPTWSLGFGYQGSSREKIIAGWPKPILFWRKIFLGNIYSFFMFSISLCLTVSITFLLYALVSCLGFCRMCKACFINSSSTYPDDTTASFSSLSSITVLVCPSFSFFFFFFSYILN